MKLYTFDCWYDGEMTKRIATGETLQQAEANLDMMCDEVDELFNIKVEHFPIYRYNAYWGTWNRILALIDFNVFELDLTPINAGWGSDVWEKTKQEVIRHHGTAFNEKDIKADEVPADRIFEMTKFYGAEIMDKLLTHDYLSEVTLMDIKRANEHSNGGGVPIKAIQQIRDGVKSYHHNG